MNQITDDAILGMLFERDETALQEIQKAYGKLCFKLAPDSAKLKAILRVA